MRCVAFKPLERGSLVGFADIELQSGIVWLGCSMHRSNGRSWCNPPGRPLVTPECTLMIGDDGRVVYSPCVEFSEKKVRYRWSDECVKAIEEFIANSKEPATTAGPMSGDGTPERANAKGRNES